MHSFYAVNCETNEVVADHQSDLPFVPASCMKIVTTGAALHLLKPEMRLETHLQYDGFIDAEGTLQGNLYICGGGDPCLGSGRTPSSLSWEMQLETWVEALSQKGIKKIAGAILADASAWEKAQAVPSWNWEDVGNYYGAGASALSFHENHYRLFFKPGKNQGDCTEIVRLEPPLSSLTLINEVTTGPLNSGDGACIYGMELAPLQIVRGTIPAGVEEFCIKGAIPDPATTCAAFLTQASLKSGIAIEGRSLPPSKERTTFHTTYSPTIQEIAHITNQESLNLYAEHLLKKMGLLVQKEGSTNAGIQAVTAFWHSQGLNLEGFHMADGSGLSRKNGLSAKHLVSILLTLKHSPYFPLFFESLPQKAPGCRGKSGSMAQVKCYAGFMDTIAFAIMVNQESAVEATAKIDHFLAQLGGK